MLHPRRTQPSANAEDWRGLASLSGGFWLGLLLDLLFALHPR